MAVVTGLNDRARCLVDLAALAPSAVSAATLARAGRCSLHEAEQALCELAEAGLLTCDSGDHKDHQTAIWRFTHAVRRQAVLDLMDDMRVQQLASDLAPALEFEPPADSGTLADLYELAGDGPKSLQFALEAAQLASRSLAYDKAVQYYDKALQHTPDTPGASQARARLYNQIGYSLWHVGRFRDARAAYRAAATIATESWHTAELVEAALGRAGRIGFEGPSGDAELVAALRIALERLGDSDDRSRARVLAATAHATTFSVVGSTEEARPLVREALAISRDQDDARLLAEVLCTTSWAIWVPDNLAERHSLAEEAVALADGLGDEVLQMESRLFRITCCFESGNTHLVGVDVDRIGQLADSEGSPYYLAMAATAQAALALLNGSESGEPFVMRALEIAQREHNTALARVFAVQIFYTRMLQGRLEELRASSENLADYETAVVAWRGGLALIYSETGRLERARDEFERIARDGFSHIPRDMFWLSTLDSLARVCLVLGDVERAGELAALLGPYADRFVAAAGAGALHGPVAMNLSLLLRLSGRLEEARSMLRRAGRLAQSAGCRAATAEAAVEEAHAAASEANARSLTGVVDLLRHAVQETEAVGSCKLALRAAEAIDLMIPLTLAHGEEATTRGLRDLERRCDNVSVEREPRPERRGGRAGLAPLTRRTVRLVAGRWTDAEIERRLSTGKAQHAVISAMEHFFQPDVAYPFRGIVVFHLTMSDPDARPIIWALRVDRLGAAREPTPPEKPDLLVRMRAADFVGLLTGKINGVAEWFEGRIDVHGDPIVAGRLVEMFGGPAPLHGLTAGTE